MVAEESESETGSGERTWGARVSHCDLVHLEVM